MPNPQTTPPQQGAQLLALALDLGERMLVSGGEVSRVEDTLCRICRAYGAERVDVFAVTSNITVTMCSGEWGILTQTRRVPAQQYNMSALIALNALSRRACAERLSPVLLAEELARIERLPVHSFGERLLIWAMISGCCSLFFGGSLLDAVCSSFVGALLQCVHTGCERVQLNSYFSVILCSVLGGLLAVLPRVAGLQVNPAAISIGNIMLLVPGIVLTSALRDMFSGDTISGLMRCSEAIIISLAIAWGFAISATGADTATASFVPLSLSMAFVDALGFGMAFNLRGRNLPLGALGGALSWSLVLLCQYLGLNDFFCFLLASVGVTLYTEILARVQRCPVTVFLIMGIIPLVPGGSLYRTMRYGIDQAWRSFASQGLRTLLFAISIAAGILCVTALADVFKRLRPQ